MWRKILLGTGLLIVAAIAACVIFAYRFETRVRREWDAQLKSLAPKVLVGDAMFTKKVFCKSPSIGRVTQIVSGGLEVEGRDGLTIISNFGVHYVGPDGQVKRTTRFPTPVRSRVELVPLDRAGNYGFLTRDQSWKEDVLLCDKSGSQIWLYPKGVVGINDSSAAEAGENGKSTFVVGFNGGGGIVLLDSQGKAIWRKSESNVWHVESLDVDGDGHREILNSNARGELLVRNMNGDIENRYLTCYYVTYFSLTRWGDESTATHILVPTTGCVTDSGKSLLIVLDAKGKTIVTLDATPGDWATKATAVPMRTKSDRLFAVIQTGVLPRSVLSVYNADNKIVYREVLGEFCSALNAASTEPQEKLFVGCDSSVWEYTLIAQH
jgi:hypothetical protein